MSAQSFTSDAGRSDGALLTQCPLALRLDQLRAPMLLLVVLCLLLYLPGQFAIPPVDRDEARFAQATKQMVETGNFVDIRFQEQPRYNKPVGVYWLQAAAVKATGVVHQIWPYRLPSWLAATAAALMTAALAGMCFGRAAGMVAGSLLATCMLLQIEARLAKADTVLLACTVAAELELAKLYLQRALSLRHALSFWIAVGCGILTKGPIILIVILGTILMLLLYERNARWLLPLRPGFGIVVVLLLTGPWFIAITRESGIAFWSGALGHDFGAKITSVQESHGGPPGYYLFTVFGTFWPWSPLLLPGGWYAWRNRSERNVRFCLAWIVPLWAVFEAVPTKLPHYILPAFPALATLSAGALISGQWPKWMRRIVFGHFVILTVGLLLGLGVAVWFLDRSFVPTVLRSYVMTSAAFAAVAYLFRRYPGTALGLGSATLVAFYGLHFGYILPRLDALWPSRQVAQLLAQHRRSGEQLVSVGYTEPSLVFLAGTTTSLLSGSDAVLTAANSETGLKGSTLLVVDQSFPPPAAVHADELGRVRGINYSNGRFVDAILLRLSPEMPQGLPFDISTAERGEADSPER